MKCIICQNEFVATTKKQKFCSNSCRQKNYRKEVKEMIADIKEKKAKRGAPFKNMPPYDKNTSNLEDKSKIEEIPVKTQKTPPNGLKGIDLAIWKSENWK